MEIKDKNQEKDLIKISMNSNVEKTVHYCQKLITEKKVLSLKLCAIGQAIDILRKVIHEIKKRNPAIYTILTRTMEKKYIQEKKKKFL